MEKKNLNEEVNLELLEDEQPDPNYSEEYLLNLSAENLLRKQLREEIKWLQENSETGEILYKIRELSHNIFYKEIDDNFSGSQRFWMEALYFPIKDPTEHREAESAFWCTEDPSITYSNLSSIASLLEDTKKTIEDFKEFNERKEIHEE